MQVLWVQANTIRIFPNKMHISFPQLDSSLEHEKKAISLIGAQINR